MKRQEIRIMKVVRNRMVKRRTMKILINFCFLLGIAIYIFSISGDYSLRRHSLVDDFQQASITIAGSTAMEKLADAVAESYMDQYPQVMVTVEFTGSSSGIEAVLAQKVDIGNSSRRLSLDEKSLGAVENIIAIDGIAVVTDSTNTVKKLTVKQLINIYAGNIRNWSEVGGADEMIVVIGREAGSGTRESFEEMLDIRDRCAYANEMDSTGAVMARVASTPGAIGYVSRDVLNENVHILAIDGFMPTDENIQSGSYRLSRPFIMVTRGAVSKQREEVQQLFSYLWSEEGKELIKAVGLVIPEEQAVK